MSKIYFSIIFLCCIGSSTFAQRNFKFSIDHQTYEVPEKTLDDLFGSAFNYIAQRGVTDNSHFDLWVKSYSDWKDHIVNGTFDFETYGNHLANSTYDGPIIPKEYLGWEEESKSGTGNPNKEKNIARRMALIRDAIAHQLIYFYTKKIIVD